MLDDFETGMDERSAAAILDDLRARLVPFLRKILAARRTDIPELVGRRYPVDAQRTFGLKVMADLGFDFEGGRQDVSVHPFCTGELGDVRITTRFFEDDLRPSLFGMIHETGHALYEQGTDPAHVLTPMGFSLSLGVHESQSRLWENLVGRSLPFWKAYYADLQAAFPDALAGVPLAGFYRFINRVEGSLIRVEADEATYNLHIVLRFEIERDLFAGRVAVSDLPAVWNAKMKQYLDVDVPDDAVGVLQDVHWSEGLMGYFPTYSLGNLYGAQLFEAAGRAIPDLAARIERRDFAPLLAWLRENVHRHGKRHSPRELIERATGRPPDAAAFVAYMERKYGEIYNL
jgi:carboxypeptidase Taq